jgi:uncharacterized protein YkwD
MRISGLVSQRIALVVAALFVVSAPVLSASDVSPANVLKVMNDYRRAHHLPDLTEDSRLDRAAGDRMNEMIEQAYWSHVSPTGITPFSWIRSRGYRFARAGENLAKGFETAEVLVQSWMESPGHRENILSPDFQQVGIAVIDGSTTGRSTGRSVVMLFGREQPDLSRGRSK